MAYTYDRCAGVTKKKRSACGLNVCPILESGKTLVRFPQPVVTVLVNLTVKKSFCNKGKNKIKNKKNQLVYDEAPVPKSLYKITL